MDGTLSNATLPFQSLLSSSPQLSIARPVAFGLYPIYEQWRFLKVRKDVRDEFREVDDLTRRLQAATERLNKANAKAEAARLKSRPK